MTPQYGMGLEGVLLGRAPQLWRHPQRRRLRRLGSAPRPFPAATLRRRFDSSVKAALKDYLMTRHGLRQQPGAALLGIVSRLSAQKGFDLLFDTLPALLAERDACLVVLGSGEPRYEAFFDDLQARFPARVVLSPRLQRRARALDRGRPPTSS